jgi:tetratricopeptide (TPR) repeat protein
MTGRRTSAHAEEQTVDPPGGEHLLLSLVSFQGRARRGFGVYTEGSVFLIRFAVVSLGLSLILAGASPTLAQTRTPPAPAKAAAKSAPAKSSFDALAAKAEAARQGGHLDEAVSLYQQALKLKPDWIEGTWSLGAALYELDRFAEARDAFRRVLTRHPENGDGWALKGLCEFRLKSYDTALADLSEARARGVTASREVAEVARYHSAILLTRMEQYEQALGIFSDFGLEGNDSPRIIEGMGLATLRIPMLPDELQGARREMVMMAGRAQYFMAARLGSAAQNAFEALANRYPETPNVHYAFGVFLMAEQPDKAIEEFKRELRVSPQHVWAKVQIAFSLIKRGEYAEAKPWAQEAVDGAPTAFVARNALGQILLETGDVDGAIRELEAGVKLASDSPAMHFALARAYRRAGRGADADREQAEFTRLDRLVREQRSGTNSLGGIQPPAKHER